MSLSSRNFTTSNDHHDAFCNILFGLFHHSSIHPSLLEFMYIKTSKQEQASKRQDPCKCIFGERKKAVPSIKAKAGGCMYVKRNYHNSH